MAVSLTNNNLSDGEYSDEDFRQNKLKDAQTYEDTVQALKDADELIKYAKIGRHFIMVNQNVVPLNPQNGLPSLAVESELGVNYFNNYLRAMIFRRGLSYISYGNDFIQTDIAGINISDRVRLLDNKMMVGVSFETKWDNTVNDVNTPRTTYNTFNTSVTAYPAPDLPSFTLGYALYTRKNPIGLNNVIVDDTLATIDDTLAAMSSSSIADESVNRFFLNANYDFNMIVRSSAQLSISVALKKDATYFKRDQNSVNISASLTSYYKIPLQTSLGFTISSNVSYFAIQDTTTGLYSTGTEKQKFNYQTLSLSARYRMLDDRLTFIAAAAPTFGDFKRLLIQAGSEYQVADNHYFTGQFDFMKNTGRANDIVFSIIYRLTY